MKIVRTKKPVNVNPKEEARKILRNAKAKPNIKAKDVFPTGRVGDHHLPHPLDPQPANPIELPAAPALRRRHRRPHPSGSGGVRLGPRGRSPDLSFSSDFAFLCGVRLLLRLLRRRATWIWRRSTRSWPRSMDRLAISSAHCSKL